MVSAHNREPQQEGASISSGKGTNKPVKTTARGLPFHGSMRALGGVQAMCSPHIITFDQVYMVTGEMLLCTNGVEIGEERG
jgi:hypothetical protein